VVLISPAGLHRVYADFGTPPLWLDTRFLGQKWRFAQAQLQIFTPHAVASAGV